MDDFIKSDFDDNLKLFENISKLLKYSLTSLRRQYDNAKPKSLSTAIKSNCVNNFAFSNKSFNLYKHSSASSIKKEFPIFVKRYGLYFLISDELNVIINKPKKCIVVELKDGISLDWNNL